MDLSLHVQERKIKKLHLNEAATSSYILLLSRLADRYESK